MVDTSLEKIIEYGVFHDNLDKKVSLPGIKNGLPIKSFFQKKKHLILMNLIQLLQKLLTTI